jgi:hypothetical protein
METHKRVLVPAVLLLLLFVVPLAAQDDRLFWHGKYEDALREAKETGKPIFLEFRCEA